VRVQRTVGAPERPGAATASGRYRDADPDRGPRDRHPTSAGDPRRQTHRSDASRIQAAGVPGPE
ncbi:hypothetical protein LTR94_038541, partial [Friedmanniomyces endolithicus]